MDALLRIGRQMRHAQDMKREAKDLTFHQLQGLHIIHKKQPMKMHDLADALGVSPASATLLVDKLIDGGWVTRTFDKEDRRIIYVQLSDETKQRFATFQKRRHEKIESLLGALNQKELGELDRILHKICETMEAKA